MVWKHSLVYQQRLSLPEQRMLFISILYTSCCCVFITNLTPPRTLGWGKMQRQLGKREGEDKTSGITSEKLLQKQREELDCQRQWFPGMEINQTTNQSRFTPKRTTEPCIRASVDAWHSSPWCSTPLPSSIMVLDPLGQDRLWKLVSPLLEEMTDGAEHTWGHYHKQQWSRKVIRGQHLRRHRLQYWWG